MSDCSLLENKSISCTLTLAKYWGMYSETVMRAAEIIRKNPKISTEKAVRSGYAQSAEAMLPTVIN